MSRVVALVVAMLLVLAGPAMADGGVIEQLRLGVPELHRELWLQAEASSWQPGWSSSRVFLEGICSGIRSVRRVCC